MKYLSLSLLLIAFLISSKAATAQSDSTSHADTTLKIHKPYPTGALLRSAFVPGWGQYYNKKYIKGTIIAAAETYLIVGVVTNWRDANKHKKNFQGSDSLEYKASEFSKFEHSRDQRNIRMWLLAAGIFYSMFDAYVDAQLWDFKQTDKSFDVYVEPVKNNGLYAGLTIKIK
jgi:hypothetical protein